MVKDYNEIFYEMETHSMTMKNLSDIDLVDSIQNEYYNFGVYVDVPEEVSKCLEKLSRDVKVDLSTEERKTMEAMYLLLYSDLGYDI